MSPYVQIIREAVPEVNVEEAEGIEEIMRNEIFHSTLDWQTRDQLKNAAKQGWEILKTRANAKIWKITIEREVKEFSPTGKLKGFKTERKILPLAQKTDVEASEIKQVALDYLSKTGKSDWHIAYIE